MYLASLWDMRFGAAGGADDWPSKPVCFSAGMMYVSTSPRTVGDGDGKV